MSRIIILGGTGQAGRILTRQLLKYTQASVTIASRHEEEGVPLAEELNVEYKSKRVCWVYADAADKNSLLKAFENQELAVIAAPITAYTAEVVNAALQTQTDYLDIQLGAEKLEVLKSAENEIIAAGRCFITEAGFHPGLPSVLVHHAATHFDELKEAITACYLNMGKNLPYTESFNEIIELFRNYHGQVFKNGEWSKPDSIDMRTIDFENDIGIKRCYSLYFNELEELPDKYPTLSELGFYMSETHWFTDWIMTPLIWMWLKFVPGNSQWLSKIMWWSMTTFHHPPYRVELQTQSRGIKKEKSYLLKTTVSHEDGYMLTAAPVLATILQYLDGTARKPGLWMMGHIVDANRLIQDMKKVGIQINTEEAEL